LRVLIVEDEPLVRLELERIAASAGHHVVGGAATGEDAVIHERCSIRSLFVSATSGHLRDSADGARPFGFLLKPIAPERLVAALKEIARQLGKSG
jgi:YesN/AraC family two-component response regulator